MSLESDDEEEINAWKIQCRENLGHSFVVPILDATIDAAPGLEDEVEATTEVLFHVGKETIRAKRPRSTSSPYSPTGHSPLTSRPRLKFDFIVCWIVFNFLNV